MISTAKLGIMANVFSPAFVTSSQGKAVSASRGFLWGAVVLLILALWHDHLPDLGCRTPGAWGQSVKAHVCRCWNCPIALLGCSSGPLWDVATARFELQPKLISSCTATVPSTNLGFGERVFPSAKTRREEQEGEVAPASHIHLSIAVVFLIPPVKVILLQTCRWITWPQHPTSHSSVIISERCLKCAFRYPLATQLVHLWKERNSNKRNINTKNRQVITGSPRPFQHSPSCFLFFFLNSWTG